MISARSLSLALALAAAASACSHEPEPAPITNRLELRDDMRELWTAHVVWTRVYLMSRISGLPDTEQAAARLLQNQDDIGDAIRPFYGDAAGDRLSTLLREHITGAVDLVEAAIAGDAAQVEAASAAWSANAEAIATFLADANPAWSRADLAAMMQAHLAQTVAEATARLRGDTAAEIAAYDEVVPHILHMADALADGIAAQRPDMVAPSPLSARDEEVHVGMRALWQHHVAWTRFYLIAAIAGTPDAELTAARLLRNQDDIGDAIRPLYGDAGADALTALLREHITIAAELVTAAVAGDTRHVAEVSATWEANADDIAELLASANPNWPVDDLRTMMRMHLAQTTTEATARITMDWAGDVAAYDEVTVHILGMSDALSAGVAAQFPDPAAHHHED